MFVKAATSNFIPSSLYWSKPWLEASQQTLLIFFLYKIDNILWISTLFSVVNSNFFLYFSEIKPKVPIEADLILQFFHISFVIKATEVLPLVPVTADI